ncbi:uncharacterized protein L203_101352 [Cryptococcus depauperatus CBS 7841]|uniref:Uncharacterized protein n=1 Tax=Cryptococcus depauperatus CBS 7841 TaxID=1295531 RepID=A0A1E3IC46_9TREE|nr:ribosomal RNA-processing protein 7 [Cryptococcus depauperatus CBS 7841]
MPKTNLSITKKGKTGSPKLYSNFLPLPLILPTPIPIPSTSSKSSKQVKHYVYCRQHKSKLKAKATPSGNDGELPEGRTVFVVNLPVDMTERELRSVFSNWGVIENVKFNHKDDGDVLESVVKGMPIDKDSDDEDEDEEGDEEEDEDEGRQVGATATFQGDLITKKQRRAMRKRNVLISAIPKVDPLPPLSPRSMPLGQSGLFSAHVIFLDSIAVSRLFSSTPSPISVSMSSNQPQKDDSEPTGLAYYTALHSTLRPPLEAIKSFADSSMARFDHLHSMLLSSRAKQAGAGALVDEDGFTVVVRSGKFGRAGARGDGFGMGGVGVATRGFEQKKKKAGVGASALPDFYRFQSVDRKKQELAELRQKFEHDKAKVEEFKKSRRYRPY